ISAKGGGARRAGVGSGRHRSKRRNAGASPRGNGGKRRRAFIFGRYAVFERKLRYGSRQSRFKIGFGAGRGRADFKEIQNAGPLLLYGRGIEQLANGQN